ncbi:MAG: hypothetical protein FWE67_09390 [Planctomycetaceae bacterium]|nr:hypothetical protein [Planctomycetaceae bacterium]
MYGNSGYTPKKRKTKSFDTKLFLFCSGSLVVLLILSLFFAASLFRRSADNMLAAANQSYEKASYAQAIGKYDDFISSFPNHSGVSTAKIRRALARIRFAVDEQSNHINAYNTAAEEIAAVENEPEFFEVSKAELSILLPRIAAGLADEAQAKTSLLHSERAELTLALLEKLLPKSMHPVEQVAAVKAKIRIVYRTAVCQLALKEAADKLGELLSTTPFDRTQVKECYAVVDSLLTEYPELAAQPDFKNLMRTVVEKEALAVIQTTAPNTNSEIRSTTEAPAKVLAVLTKQTPLAKKESDDSRRQVSRIHPFYYDENLYGIYSVDGSLVWKQPLKNFVSAGITPKYLPIQSSKNIRQHGFILVNTEDGTFRRYDNAAGKLLSKFSLGEKVFVSSIAQNETACFFAAASKDGKLHLFEVGTDSVKTAASYQMPQNADSPPLVDLSIGSVLQFADSQTLFKVPLQDKTQNILSFYSEHSPLTIRTAPVMFGAHCLFIRQTGAKSCELAVFAFDEKINERVLQTFPISGLVDFPIKISGDRCFVHSDAGELSLFAKNDNPIEPLKPIGKGTAGINSEIGTNLHAAFLGGGLNSSEIWIAGNQLTMFYLQPAQNRIVPQKALRTGIETLSFFHKPYRLYESRLTHFFTEPDWGGLQVAEYHIGQSKTETPIWTAEVAAPIIQEPQFTVGDNSMTVYTSNGKSWKVPLDTGEAVPVLELPDGAFGTFKSDTGKNGARNVKFPLGRVIPLRDGYSAWVSAGKDIRIFDPTAKENKFVLLALPSPLAGFPIELDGHMLAPTDETLMLYNVRTCRAVASFKPLRHIGKAPKWTAPVNIPKTASFLIADNLSEGLNSGACLYRITWKKEDTALVQEKCFELERPVISPLAVVDNKAAFIDDRHVLHILNLTSEEKEPKYLLSEELDIDTVWGPYTVGSGFIFALRDGTMRYYAADGKLRELRGEPMPVPVGLPFCIGESVLVNSADGTVRQFSLKTYQTEFNIETGLKLSAGAAVINKAIYLSGRDGTIYLIPPEGKAAKEE